MIKVKDMSAQYEAGRPTLEHISFAVDEGESLAIVGANGAGKSTLLGVLVGLVPYTEGSVSVAGLNVSKENYAAIRQRVGVLLQNPDDQILEGEVAKDLAFGLRGQELTEEKIRERSLEVLRRLGREDLYQGTTYKLSFGEKKLVALAGLLVRQPSLLLLDEPTSALDPRTRKQFITYLREIPQTKLIVTHDLDMVFTLCPHVLILHRGKLAAAGWTEEILMNEELLTKLDLELPLCCAKRCK